METFANDANNSKPILIGGPPPMAFLDEPFSAQCGHRIIDPLLTEFDATDSSLVDLLLDLKFALLQMEDAEETLENFCRLRPRLEECHYLACYRLRRWLERQIGVSVSPGRGYAARAYALKLIPHTMEGIAAAILRAATKDGLSTPGGIPRINFHFVRLHETAKPGPR